MNITQQEINTIIISSIASWGLVQIIKPLIKAKLSKDNSLALTRASAVLLGSVAGYTLMKNVEGFWIGFSAGAFNAVLVAKIKQIIKSHSIGDKDSSN